MIKLVIFDMDGLMFDTERATGRAYMEKAKEWGYEPTMEQYLQFLGLNGQAIQAKYYEFFDKDIDAPVSETTDRTVTTGGHYAFLKIAEGCDKRCTYCIIPYLRGKFRSVPMEQLVKEAGELAQKGVKELILVAQETTLYGKDLYGKKMLPELLKKLCAISGLQWIRLQ